MRFGELHLTAVGLLAAKITAENCGELIQLARHRSADEIKRLLADREPKPDVPTRVRQLPGPQRLVTADTPASTNAAPQPSTRPDAEVSQVVPKPETSPSGKTEPLGEGRYVVRFMADGEMRAQLEELRALMRHQIPDGDIAKILKKGVAELLLKVRKQKFAETSRPERVSASSEHSSRHVPAVIKRAVWQRDGGRCTYVSASGRRCGSREFIEFHHVDAWARSRSHLAEGITLRCRAHNVLRARIDFGEQHMAQFRRAAGFESSSP